MKVLSVLAAAAVGTQAARFDFESAYHVRNVQNTMLRSFETLRANHGAAVTVDLEALSTKKFSTQATCADSQAAVLTSMMGLMAMGEDMAKVTSVTATDEEKIAALDTVCSNEAFTSMPPLIDQAMKDCAADAEAMEQLKPYQAIGMFCLKKNGNYCMIVAGTASGEMTDATIAKVCNNKPCMEEIMKMGGQPPQMLDMMCIKSGDKWCMPVMSGIDEIESPAAKAKAMCGDACMRDTVNFMLNMCKDPEAAENMGDMCTDGMKDIMKPMLEWSCMKTGDKYCLEIMEGDGDSADGPCDEVDPCAADATCADGACKTMLSTMLTEGGCCISEFNRLLGSLDLPTPSGGTPTDGPTDGPSMTPGQTVAESEDSEANEMGMIKCVLDYAKDKCSLPEPTGTCTANPAWPGGVSGGGDLEDGASSLAGSSIVVVVSALVAVLLQ